MTFSTKKFVEKPTINGMTVEQLLDDYAGRHREMEKCKKYFRDEFCEICEADKIEMEKIKLSVEIALIGNMTKK